jgi:hypothetical protein
VTAPADIDGLLERLLGPDSVPAEQVRLAIRGGVSIVGSLDAEQRAVVRDAWRSFGFMTVFVTPHTAVERLVGLRPELAADLRSDAGTRWIRGELAQIQQF